MKIENLIVPKRFKDRRNQPSRNEIVEGREVEISCDDYHDPSHDLAASSLSRSELTSFIDDPVGFYHKKVKGVDPGKDKDELRFGKVWHVMTLESKETYERVPASALTSNGQRRGNAWNEWHAEHGDWYLLDKEYEKACRMRDAVLANPIYRDFCTENRFIPELEHEKTIVARHEPTNLNTRIRLDVFSRTLCDLKSAANVKPDKFAVHALDYGYHQQAALYCDVVQALTGEQFQRPFAFIACKKTPPYTVEVYVMDEEFIDLGRRMNYRAFDLFAAFWDMHTQRVAAGVDEADNEEAWKPATHGQAVRLMMPPRGMYVEDYLPDPNDYIKRARELRVPQ